MSQNEDNVKEQALHAYCVKTGNFIEMMPEAHRAEAAVVFSFAAIMCAHNGNALLAKGMAVEVSDMIRNSEYVEPKENDNTQGDQDV